MSRIPLSDIEQFLVSGWMNVDTLDVSRLIPAGQTVTIVISDAPFTVPDPLPGGANVIASKQYTIVGSALIKVRVITRDTE